MQVRSEMKGHRKGGSEQPLKFGFQLRTAQVGGDNGAVFIDQNGVGDAADAVALGGNTAPSAQIADVIRPNQAVLVNGPLLLLDVFVERYREDFESLVFVFLPSAHHVGIFSATRPAPTCPEVDQYDFALQV